MGKTIQVSGFPQLVSAEAAKQCIEEHTGNGSIVALQTKMTKGAYAKPIAIVQFKTEESAEQILDLANQHQTLYYRESLLMAKELETPIVEPRLYAHEIDRTPVCFGCQISRERFCVLWRKRNVGVKFGIGFKNVSLFLFLDNDLYKLLLSYEDIWRVTQHFPRGQNSKFLVIQLFAAPRIYKKTEVEDSVNTFYLEAPGEDQWVRTTDFSPNYTIGQSTALCLKLPSNAYLDNSFVNYRETSHFDLEDGSSFSPNSSLVPIINPPSGLDLPFKIVFKICGLVQHGCIPGPALDEKFFQLVDPSRVSIERIEYALERMQNLKDCCYDPAKWLTQEYARFKQPRKKPARTMEEGIAYIRRVSVTPIRVYFFGPEPNMSNRVLRQFRDDIDRFLRVSFVDEDWEKIHSVDLSPRSTSAAAAAASRTAIYNRILTTLENGIVIGDKKFEFLAFSSSQLRESSAWLFASRSGLTAADIRAWMGDFHNIKNVAKYAARLGQSFGSSRETSSVESNEVELIPDIELQKEDGTKYTFSDGIGKISAEFAKKVAEKCGGLRKPPSAYQIRYGGYKGVVAIDPISSKKLSLRKSMLKYESGNTKLDVLAWSKYQPCYLNRQIITLLSTLGIADEVFERKQREVVSQLDDMLTDPNKAQEFLELMPPGDNANALIEMLRCGYKPNVEPFLSTMLQTIRGARLQELRTRTRIFIPDGRSMMGCLDETGTLEYGEVFVQYSGAGRRHPHLTGVSRYNLDGIILGPVVVAKNPCLHPGDVRVLKAVDVRALHHMVDCIVFPQKGHRPHPNECSGSDLDGDIYFVCWDPDFIPKRMVSPTDYTPVPVTPLDHDVTIQEIQKYFADSILNDNLGVISNCHVVFADKEPDMALSEPCLELARIFSIAVDFPKTGVPAEIPHNLRVREYPDFMDKPGRPSYESQRVIGKLFRQVKDISANWSFISPFTMKAAKRSYDLAMEVDGFKDYIQEAFDYKTRFDEKLGSLMDYYGIKTEAELLTGCVNDPAARLYDRRRDGEAVIMAVRSLRKEARSWFFDHRGGGRRSEAANQELRKKQRASAWYHVTYHHSFWGRYKEGTNHEHFISFPWCVYEILIKIKKENPAGAGAGSGWDALNFTSFEWLCNIC